MLYHDTQLKSVSHGDVIEQYLQSDAYKQDKLDSTGLNIWGDTRTRARLFPVMGRALTLMGENVFLTQMVVVRDIAMHEDHPLSEKLMNCSALMIQFFCSPGDAVPYSPAERANIEHILLTRANHRHRNYFSSMTPLLECSWWSAEFLGTIEAHTKDLQV